MNPFIPTLFTAVLAMSAASPGHAGAASAPQPALLGAASQASVFDDLVQVRSGNRWQQQRHGANRRGVQRRGYDNRARRAQPPRRAQPHRPSRSHRSGPDLGSAVVGAIIGGIIVHQFQQQPQPRAQSGAYLGQQHINWCHNRWRSYRVSDNSYQPYTGPRRVCVSPYGPY